ncbi:arginase family protein [Marinivivus vitaminiproducens]|uniref:arginase family protein n=1 Tax=Marinivivus vitaminiproducens TaxID=3035935 RepID=UPI0027A5D542|nr:arginase family protein [Geminicoccaceae bacterium SCSIO 64248]
MLFALAGLIEALRAAGRTVEDLGDIPAFRWRPDRVHPFAQNTEAVRASALAVAGKVEAAVAAGAFPLVLGGDCTVELGTVAGHVPADDQLGLLYFDLHPDLNTPEAGERRPGALDWMGVAHMLGEAGCVEQLARIAPRYPMLADTNLLLFAWGPGQATEPERAIIARRALAGITVDEVRTAPVQAAEQALRLMETRVDRLLVHFDVDVIDFTDTPLSENTGRNEGLAFEQAFAALGTILQSPRCAALTVTELNPDHGAADGSTVRRFVEALASCLR